MKDKTKARPLPEPIRLENGKKVFRLQCRVDSAFRPPLTTGGPPVPPKPETGQGQPEGLENAAAGSGDDRQDAGPTEEPDILLVPTRVLSAVDTWSWTWWGPQLVVNGHNDSYALRKMAGYINTRKRPVPVMRDHTNDIEAKCGRLVNGRWEGSTDIPPGVNADMRINRRFAPWAATGLETGELDATSVHWGPEMEMSHPDMDIGLFMQLQGSEIDGKIVAWWPIDLEPDGVIHHALVWAGADPFSGPREEQGPQLSDMIVGHSDSNPQISQIATDVQNQSGGACPGLEPGAATNRDPEGGTGMEEKLIGLILTLCNALNVNAVVMAGKELPDWLEKSLTDRVETLNTALGSYNELAQKLQSLGNSLLKEGETALTAAQVLERLPERVAMAKHGEAFLAHQRKEAVTWHDRRYLDPQNAQNMTDAQKRQRTRLETCNDLQVLADSITENRAAAEARFGPQHSWRVTAGSEDLPQVDGVTNASAEQRRAEASVERWKTGGKS